MAKYTQLVSISDYPDYYCDELGNIYSKKKGELKIRKVQKHRNGYMSLILRNSLSKPRRILVHRIIAGAFLGNIQGLEIDHINGNKEDNRLSNLRICTSLENSRFQNKVKNSSSGAWGIVKHRGKYQLIIQKKYCGRFSTFIEALSKREELCNA